MIIESTGKIIDGEHLRDFCPHHPDIQWENRGKIKLTPRTITDKRGRVHHNMVCPKCMRTVREASNTPLIETP